MSKVRYKKGDVLFEKGDNADKMYYIGSGSVRLLDLDINVGVKQIIGEMGIFSPFKERTDTAVCDEDMDVFVIDEDKINQLYYQNPSFGFYLIRLLTKRFILNAQRAVVPPREDRDDKFKQDDTVLTMEIRKSFKSER
jgi:CRP-like cAMP-binding protein